MDAVWKRQILLCKVLHYILTYHMKLELFKPDFHFFVIIDGLEPKSPNVQRYFETNAKQQHISE